MHKREGDKEQETGKEGKFLESLGVEPEKGKISSMVVRRMTIDDCLLGCLFLPNLLRQCAFHFFCFISSLAFLVSKKKNDDEVEERNFASFPLLFLPLATHWERERAEEK